jgi:hypothetical protein
MKRKATIRVALAMAGLGTIVALGAPESGNWRDARGMSRGKGQDIVKVREAAGDTLALAAGAQTNAGQAIRLEYAMPALTAVKEPGVADGQSALVLGNAPVSGDTGKPMLPVAPCYIALPAGTELDGVEVVCGKETKLAGRHTIVHGQKPIPLLKDAKAATSAKATAAEEVTLPDAAVYGSDESWPKARYEVVTVQKKRGMSVAVINLNPVVYKPLSGQVSYFETMELRVKARSTGSPQASSGQATALATALAAAGSEPEVRVREDPIRPLSEQVDNPAALDSYRSLINSEKPAAK